MPRINRLNLAATLIERASVNTPFTVMRYGEKFSYEFGVKQMKLDRLNVLLVDDSRNMLRLLEDIVRSFKVRHVVSATNVSDAFSEMQINAIDIAIVDWEMQPLNGLDFVQIIRTAKGSPNKHVPIIMLTAHTEVSKVLSARDAGVNDFLAKPVSPRTLYQRIVSVLNKPQTFVQGGSYFGPDRRHHEAPTEGPDLRNKNTKQVGELLKRLKSL